MGTSAHAATDMGYPERGGGSAGPGGRISDGERHALAVRQSLRWAVRAAQEGDYERALGWLRMVEQVDGRLGPEWRRRRDEWRTAWTAQLVDGSRGARRGAAGS